MMSTGCLSAQTMARRFHRHRHPPPQPVVEALGTLKPYCPRVLAVLRPLPIASGCPSHFIHARQVPQGVFEDRSMFVLLDFIGTSRARQLVGCRCALTSLTAPDVRKGGRMAAPRAVRVLLTALFGALTVLTGPDKRKVTAPGVRDNALHPHLGSQGQAHGQWFVSLRRAS